MIIQGVFLATGIGAVERGEQEKKRGHNIQDMSSGNKQMGEERLLSASQTDPSLSHERVPSAPDVRTILAAHLARALIPFLLREAELFQDHLN